MRALGPLKRTAAQKSGPLIRPDGQCQAFLAAVVIRDSIVSPSTKPVTDLNSMIHERLAVAVIVDLRRRRDGLSAAR
jgi:hypothetical protein